MPKTSAGILLYRRREGRVEVLLVHPGGPYWSGRDAGAWSIPKGEHGPSEPAMKAARREFEEETGFAIDGPFEALTPQTQPSGKVVQAWAVEGDCDAEAIRSQPFEMEWPPRSGRKASFPEVDRAGWFDLSEARVRILAGQRGFLDELGRKLGEPHSTGAV